MKHVVLAVCLMLCAAPAWAEVPTAAANAAYLAAGAKQPGTVTRPSGLQYRVLHAGFGRRAGSADILRVTYRISLIDDTLLDSATPGLPATLTIGGVTFAGLNEALSLMHEGDRWQLVIPPNLGLSGASSAAGQTLVMDLTLLSATAPKPGETVAENPFSFSGDSRKQSAVITIHP